MSSATATACTLAADVVNHAGKRLPFLSRLMRDQLRVGGLMRCGMEAGSRGAGAPPQKLGPDGEGHRHTHLCPSALLRWGQVRTPLWLA